jgi:hypothetical protein
MEASREPAGSNRPHGWNDWYRFARRELGLTHDESAEYANRRYVEEQNRNTLRGGGSRLPIRPYD